MVVGVSGAKLTRRGRAAMQLALEVLRRDVRMSASIDLWSGAPITDSIKTFEVAGLFDLIRALAARLRADAGDCGPWRCGDCDRECHPDDDHCFVGCLADDLGSPMVPHRRIAPLWEQAGLAFPEVRP